MGNKKRNRKKTVHSVIEGEKREAPFLEFLKEIYLDPKRVSLKVLPDYGGNPNRHVDIAIRNSFFDKSFAWIDEDKDLNKETRNTLSSIWHVPPEKKNNFLTHPLKNLQQTYNIKQRNPILIISQPVCVDALILRTLGYQLPFSEYLEEQRDKQIKTLKNTLTGIVGGKSDEALLAFCREKLNRKLLEEKRKNIPELHLLISMLEAD